LTGKIVTADGGPLAFPDSDQAGYPAAAIFLHPSGTVDADNPLGDESATALDGTFQLNDLVAGTYDITVESLGYQPVKLSNVVLNSLSTTALGTITLQNGPSLTATVAKPDGSAVNTNDVNMAVAATSDLSSIIFGRIQSDAATTNILSVSFAGFQLSPSNYSILLFDNNDNIILPTEGRNLVFASTGD